jgi:hypothetical protein
MPVPDKCKISHAGATKNRLEPVMLNCVTVAAWTPTMTQELSPRRQALVGPFALPEHMQHVGRITDLGVRCLGNSIRGDGRPGIVAPGSHGRRAFGVASRDCFPLYDFVSFKRC